MITIDRGVGRAARAWLLMSGLVIAGSLPAEPLPVPATGGTSKEASIECNDSLYRFLPGEVNFCLAARERQRNNAVGTLEMLKLAAGWGSKKAQYALGLMYFNGELVTANRPLGLAWLGLAAERGDRVYGAVFASAYGKATTTERQQAQTRYASLLPVYADAVAARRAQRRFDREMHELSRFEPYPSDLCIAGIAGIAGGVAIDQGNPVCPSSSVAVTRLNRIGDMYFEGWVGHVSVGALQPVRNDDHNQREQPSAGGR
ncbi:MULTISPECIES: hypothetical protein [unclassified Rhodanobacter]|uniref:Sel1 repeat family protein n=1 Tax=Rhodanobacter humi TaxID=1888173 RepID=A0ABV4ANU7_9GAMM